MEFPVRVVAKLGPFRRLLNGWLQFERYAVYASGSIEPVDRA